MTKAAICYCVGIIAGATGGFVSPWPFTGFFVIAAGAIWAAYDLVEIKTDGDTKNAAPRRNGWR